MNKILVCGFKRIDYAAAERIDYPAMLISLKPLRFATFSNVDYYLHR